MPIAYNVAARPRRLSTVEFVVTDRVLATGDAAGEYALVSYDGGFDEAGVDDFVTRALMDPDSDEERLLREPIHAHRVMEATSEAVLILTPDGTCEYVNRAAEQLLGWPRSWLVGRDIHPLLHPDGEHACLFRRPFQDALPVTQATDMFGTARGWRQPVEVSISPSISKGVVDSVVCMFSDATARLQRERDQQQLIAAQKEAVARLEALAAQQKDFVSTVTHELRTPLTSIMGYMEVVREDSALSEDTVEALDVVERNARRLLTQVEALLMVARIESGAVVQNMTDVDVATVIREATEVVRPQVEAKGLTLTVSLPDEMPAVHGAADHLDRVVVNLLSNAIKFTPAGGTVTVTATGSGRWIQVQVADTGMGIPEREQHRLFEKFFRSSISQKKATQGTGLGLAIVKAIVEEHGGKIAVHSKEGVGTAVAFTLPVATG